MSDDKHDKILGILKPMSESIANLQIGMQNVNKRLDKVDQRLKSLEDRVFNEDEKEEVLAMVRHYNDRLEKETLGQAYITLTPAGYKKFIAIAGLPNRFA